MRRLHVQRAATADHLLDLVGPDPGGVDHDPGAYLELRAGGTGLQVPGAYADHPLPLAQEPGDLDPGRDVRAVGGGGAGEGDHQPGVVDLAVVVLDRPGDRVGLEVRCDPGDLAAEEVPVPGHPHRVDVAEHRHRVVEGEPGADVRPLPAAVRERVEEGHRPDQVRGEPGEQQPALLERLAHQPEVEHLEVAQAPVDQLAAATAGAAGQVALLQQPGAQPAGDGVQGGAGPDHPAADDEHVELALAGEPPHRREGGVTSLRSEGAGLASVLAHVIILAKPGNPRVSPRRHPPTLIVSEAARVPPPVRCPPAGVRPGAGQRSSVRAVLLVVSGCTGEDPPASTARPRRRRHRRVAPAASGRSSGRRTPAP